MPNEEQTSILLASDYVPHVCDDLSLSDETTRTANALAGAVELAQCSSGRTPRTIAGACVYVAVLLTAESFAMHRNCSPLDDGTDLRWKQPSATTDISQSDITSVLQLSRPTIRNIYPAVADEARQQRDWDTDIDRRLKALSEATTRAARETKRRNDDN